MYKSKLNIKQTQKAIRLLKLRFEKELSKELNLDRISAPILVKANCGINDDLNGVERPVCFDVLNLNGGEKVEIVQSLAKWKRMALNHYDYELGTGIYTDMTAIRRDDKMDPIHSIYVDQWDWERIIDNSQRNLVFLKNIVRKIVKAIKKTNNYLKKCYKELSFCIYKPVYFISSEKLLKKYPNLTAKKREYEICKDKKIVFIMQIGKTLSNGELHDNRAPDYDDWELNGDLLFWDDELDDAIEISSMGIRVDANSLKEQLKKLNCEDRLKFEYHKLIAENKLPLTIGGGIGQSRLSMLLLQKKHIGEVQASVWNDEQIEYCKLNNIELL